MKRITQRPITIAALSAGLITAAGTAANAGLALANHSEPIARDHR